MIIVNPSPPPVDPELVSAYENLAPATLGHIVETAMETAIQPVWRPIKLVGTALTVQTYPQITSAVAAALKIARPGDVLVIARGDEYRHATTGEIGCLGQMEVGIAGMVTDGPIADRVAIERMQFPVFSRGSVAMTGKTGGWGIEWGAVNVPVKVGGVVVNPGDMVFGDDDGVLVASPEEARQHLAFVQEKEAWEEWVRGEIAKGRTISQCRAERPDPMTKVTVGTIRR